MKKALSILALLMAIVLVAACTKEIITEPTTSSTNSMTSTEAVTTNVTSETARPPVQWPSVFLQKDGITLEELNAVILGYGWEGGETWMETVQEGDVIWEGIEARAQVASEKTNFIPLADTCKK